jgi:GTP cyclohydrolase I
MDSPLPDPNGLGWPGQFLIKICPAWKSRLKPFFNQLVTAKSTVLRLNATPEEKAARDKRLAEAVRTVLECIGEDPDREGLQRTPERYAQALLWMTKGYEERLAGP